MKKIHLHSLWFWIVLLVIAFLNAILRETTYKPLLEPHIGIWAHQLSCFTGILFFGIAIYLFFKHTKAEYTIRDTWRIGTIWVILTIIFEFSFGYFVRQSTWEEMLAQYHFWEGDLWILVLIAVIVLPRWSYKRIKGE